MITSRVEEDRQETVRLPRHCSCRACGQKWQFYASPLLSILYCFYVVFARYTETDFDDVCFDKAEDYQPCLEVSSTFIIMVSTIFICGFGIFIEQLKKGSHCSFLIVILLCAILLAALVTNLSIVYMDYNVFKKNIFNMPDGTVGFYLKVAEIKWVIIFLGFEIYFIILPLLTNYDTSNLLQRFPHFSFDLDNTKNYMNNDYFCKHCNYILKRMTTNEYARDRNRLNIVYCSICTHQIRGNDYIWVCENEEASNIDHPNGIETCLHCVVKEWDAKHMLSQQFFNFFLCVLSLCLMLPLLSIQR